MKRILLLIFMLILLCSFVSADLADDILYARQHTVLYYAAENTSWTDSASGADMTVGDAPAISTGWNGNNWDFEYDNTEFLKLPAASIPSGYDQTGSFAYCHAVSLESMQGAWAFTDNNPAPYLTDMWGMYAPAGTTLTLYACSAYVDITGVSVGTSTWYDICASYNATTDNLSIYVNGVFNGTNTAVSSCTGGSKDIWAGVRGDYGTSGYYFDGKIDELMWVNSTISSEFVEWRYAGGSPTTDQQFPYTMPIVISSDSRIAPVPTFEESNLTGYCNSSVITNNVTYYYQWFLNDTLNVTGSTSGNFSPGVEINVDNISSTLTSPGENWTLSCIAQDAVTLSNSTWTNFTTTIIANPPGFSSPTDNAVSGLFPQIGDMFMMNISVNDANTIDTCHLVMNDTGTYENKTNITVGVVNVLLQMNYTIQNYSITNMSTIGWRVWCNNSLGFSSESSIINFTVVDLTFPMIVLNPNNGWNTNNLTIVSNYDKNLTINITFGDFNLFQASINITCDGNGTIYYWEILDINTTYYTKTETVNLGGMLPQKCTPYVSASDDHTDEEIEEYQVTKLNNGLKYKTTEGINIEILTNDLKDVNTKKFEDRYDFQFEFNEKKLKKTFNLKSDYPLYYRQNSGYDAHFVSWNKEGNWIDFEIEQDVDYDVMKVSDYEYLISIEAKVNNTKLVPKLDGLFDLFGDPIPEEELILDMYGLEDITFKSIGGTNIFNVSYDFYIGGTLNVTGINTYGGDITNWTVSVITLTGYPDRTQTETVNVTTAFLYNFTNGTYQLEFYHPQYFNQTYYVTVSDIIQDLNYSSYQSILNIQVENALTSVLLYDWNATLNYTTVISEQYTNTTTNTFYINATLYDGIIEKLGYQDLNFSYTTVYRTNHSLLLTMSVLAQFNFIDEKTLLPFNMTSPDTITLFLYCPTETTQTVLTTNISYVPIGCPYERFRFVLDYGLTSYYRSFIYDYDEIFNVSIYLIDLITTQSIFNSFIIDDLFSDYDSPSIYITKEIMDSNPIITADYVDIENKIGAYLIENHEYSVEVHSSNKPIRIIGSYFADIAGNKNLRLYDIALGQDEYSFISGTHYTQGVMNVSDDLITYASFEDDWNITTSVTYTIWKDSTLGTLLNTVTTLYTGTPLEFTYNATANRNDTLVSQLGISYLGDYHNTTKIVSQGDQTVSLDILDLGFINRNFLNWFITIVLGVLAIMATIGTAEYVALIIFALASLLRLFGWYQIHWSVLAFGIILTIFLIFKKGDKKMDVEVMAK